jgi:hypothetical protein
MTTYTIDWDYGEGGVEEIEAASLYDALEMCRQRAHDGDWNIDDTGVTVLCRAYSRDDDGDIDEEITCSERIDPDEPECPRSDDGAHEWRYDSATEWCHFCDLIRRTVPENTPQGLDVTQYDTSQQASAVDPLWIESEDEAAAMNSILHCGHVKYGDDWDTHEAWKERSVRDLARRVLQDYRSQKTMPTDAEIEKLAVCCS